MMRADPTSCLFEAVRDRAELVVDQVIEQPTVFSNSPPLCLSAGELGCVPESQADVREKMLVLARLWLGVPEFVENDELVESRFGEWVKHVPESAGTRDALWEEFWGAWESAIFKIDADILGMALELAERLELPPTINLKTPIRRKMLLVFVALQQLKGRGTVFGSTHGAGKHFGIPSTTAWSSIEKLESLGLLQCVKRGIPRVRCTRYRVSPAVMATVRECSPDRSESASVVNPVGVVPAVESAAGAESVQVGEEVFV